ncbi:MAG: trypsin-like serine protease [Actinobacteria bacterium]|nr:trypsin-like serine protease [Actinomycetota bacterium]
MRPSNRTLGPALSLALTMVVLAAVPGYGAGTPEPAPPTPQIVGGTEVTPGDYPFMAALVWRNAPNAKNGLRCGATMLDAEWFLTAAHCTEGWTAAAFDIVVGRDVLTSTDGERIAVAEIHEHPGWDTDTYENDLTLLKMATAAAAGEPIYWATEALSGWFDPGVVSTVIGWGVTENNPPGTGTGVQDVLREVDVPIRTAAECTAAVPPGEFFPALMICAGLPEGGLDSCQGDSGGPLIVAEGDRWRQAGIVSWGYGCADPGDYGYYTRLATYDQWILDTTGLVACEGAPATLEGTPGSDELVGTSGHDVIVGGAGNDTLRAGSGADILCGGIGNDSLRGGADDDLVFGEGGHDRLYGGSGADHLFGGLGEDVIAGGPGADHLHGGIGSDTVRGGAGDDELRGQAGDDRLRGGSEDDTLLGGRGVDRLNGGSGTDVCTGGETGFAGCETID